MGNTRLFLSMALGLSLCNLVGCINIDTSTLVKLAETPNRFVGPETIGGKGSTDELVDAQPESMTRKYASKHANRTLTLPVVLETPNADIMFPVTGRNALDYSISKGTFKCGAIVAREFRKVVDANFHLVSGEEEPLARIIVRVPEATVKQVSGYMAEAALRIRIDVRKNDGSASAYSRDFSATCRRTWENDRQVPSAFYEALDTIVGEFLADWDSNYAVATVLRWNNIGDQAVATATAKQKTPPELKTIRWQKEGDAWRGWCKIQCNDYEGFQAKSWANAQIAASCRTKLGDIPQERVRVFYDAENFDENAREWTFEFRAQRLKWNDSAPHGVVPPELKAIKWQKESDVWHGQCEVLCNDFEGFQAKAWANTQIAATCQTKLGGIEPERVRVLYDTETFDGKGLWTFTFRTFGRSPMVLSFDKYDIHGQVIGDIELMNLRSDNKMDIEKAAEQLKTFVLSQMKSYIGAVSLEAQKGGEALVRFDDFKMDTTYNLVTIRFRLVNQ